MIPKSGSKRKEIRIRDCFPKSNSFFDYPIGRLQVEYFWNFHDF